MKRCPKCKFRLVAVYHFGQTFYQFLCDHDYCPGVCLISKEKLWR